MYSVVVNLKILYVRSKFMVLLLIINFIVCSLPVYKLRDLSFCPLFFFSLFQGKRGHWDRFIQSMKEPKKWWRHGSSTSCMGGLLYPLDFDHRRMAKKIFNQKRRNGGTIDVIMLLVIRKCSASSAWRPIFL